MSNVQGGMSNVQGGMSNVQQGMSNVQGGTTLEVFSKPQELAALGHWTFLVGNWTFFSVFDIDYFPPAVKIFISTRWLVFRPSGVVFGTSGCFFPYPLY